MEATMKDEKILCVNLDNHWRCENHINQHVDEQARLVCDREGYCVIGLMENCSAYSPEATVADVKII